MNMKESSSARYDSADPNRRSLKLNTSVAFSIAKLSSSIVDLLGMSEESEEEEEEQAAERGSNETCISL